MKPIIRFSFIIITALVFTSCTKTVFYEDEDPITGSWVLTDAAHKDAYGWYPVTTGIEAGVFTFYNNGTARYSEHGVVMHGTWRMYYSNEGYYDEWGNYYSDRHQSLEVNLSDGYGENINMYFDNGDIYGNRIVATNYSDHIIERYRFGRY